MSNKLQIKDIIKATNLDRETIRFYEQKKLLPKAERSLSGYRQFDSAVIQRIKFIKLAQEVGFSLREIAELLNLDGEKKISKSRLIDIIHLKITHVDERVQSLLTIKKILKNYEQTLLKVKKGSNCSILAQLKNLDLA